VRNDPRGLTSLKEHNVRMASLYEQLGASATKADVHDAVAGTDPGLYPTAFCRIGTDVLGDDPEWCSIAHADGAGTKAVVAYLAFRETGDARWFRGLAQDALVMNIDDMACVGAVDRFLMVNTIGRHARLIPGNAVAEIIAGFEDCRRHWRQFGIEVAATGGETADLGDSVRTLVVDAALATRMPRRRVVDAGNIEPGLAIVGLSSTGRAWYEDSINSGMAANGMTLARHILLHGDYRRDYPESVAPDTDPALAYRGRFKLGDGPPRLGMTVAAALLSPTRTYTPILKQVLATLGDRVRGIIHNTGGGLGKCLRFGRNVHYVKDDLFETPSLFRLIAEQGVSPLEMARTFNMGCRMEVYVSPADAGTVVEISERFGVAARVVGRCEEKASGNRVTVHLDGATIEMV
jgi:phosphoribosylformylglycinamidine cyclo-ligase